MIEIFWDAYGLQSIYSGIGRFAWNVALALQKTGTTPHIIPSVPVASPFTELLADDPALPGRFRNLKPIALKRSAALLKSHTKKGLIHGWSNYNIPDHYNNLQSILTVHDLIPFLAENGSSKTLKYYLKWQMPRVLHDVDIITCSSHWTKDTVEERYPFVKGRTVLLPPGRPKAPETAAERDGRSLLTISRAETYKRLKLIPEILRGLSADSQWCVVTDDKGLKDLAPFAEKDARLKLFRALKDKELQELWLKTSVYVHPSLMEGYGLPIAEAIAYGIPALATGGSGVDDAIGKAGLKLSPQAKAEEWAEAIVKLQGEDWKERCGAQYASLPTWDDVGKQVLSIYAMLSHR